MQKEVVSIKDQHETAQLQYECIKAEFEEYKRDKKGNNKSQGIEHGMHRHITVLSFNSPIHFPST